MTYKVALIPGDGIAPEVAEQAVRILDATGVANPLALEAAIRSVLREGRTLSKDLGGTASTRDMADAIIDRLTEV
ncbi:MAG TPA: hypothetical protein VEU07_02525 [Candidatus Acidoferrum sp.]|nr:hypothetical protein [Candidatus Acidoferrum sp.]